jgi:molybdopterin-containing oxidoreductase family iron-sulfur binding subunit
MEKCNYCIQRISAARVKADIEERPIHDGEVKTACQQACPAEAISFGNLADRKSDVRTKRSSPRNYSLLPELGTRPRTTYLARVGEKAEDVDGE